MNRTYMVVYERMAEDNWGAWCPDLSGAVGAGDSLDQARQSLQAGVDLILEDLAERGLAAPPASSTSIDFSEFDSHPAGHYEIEWMTVDLPAFPETASRPGNQQATAA